MAGAWSPARDIFGDAELLQVSVAVDGIITRAVVVPVSRHRSAQVFPRGHHDMYMPENGVVVLVAKASPQVGAVTSEP